MKRNGKGSTFKWLLVLAAGIGIGYLIFSPKEENIKDAIDKSHAAVEIHASDETSATFTVSRLNTGPRKLTIVIPAGTLIRNSDPDGQWLMTARALVIHLSDDMPQVTQQVETYCLHQFSLAPTIQSELAVATSPSFSGGGGVSSEELEPLHKLADCLAQENAGRSDRELAVWMLADERTKKSYDEVMDQLRSQFRQQAETKMREQLSGEIRDKLRQQWPTLSEERLQQEIDYYRNNTLEKRITEQSEQKAAEEIRNFVRVAKPLLEHCGNKTAEMRFFQTAPQGISELWFPARNSLN